MSRTYELDGNTYDVLPEDAGDDVAIFPGFQVAKNCTFSGKRFSIGDPVTIAMRNHIRFETLVTSGLVKKV